MSSFYLIAFVLAVCAGIGVTLWMRRPKASAPLPRDTDAERLTEMPMKRPPD